MYNAMCTTPHELISGKGSNYYTVTLTPKKSTQTHPQLMVSSLPKQKSAGYMRSVWYLPSPPLLPHTWYPLPSQAWYPLTLPTSPCRRKGGLDSFFYTMHLVCADRQITTSVCI